MLQTKRGAPVAGAAVRLLTQGKSGAPAQMGATVLSDAEGRYRFTAVPPGRYTLVVEKEGQIIAQEPLTAAVGERGEPLPELVQLVEVAMP